MFRTSRMARRGRRAATLILELRLPRDERRAARAERAAERQMNLERDNPHSAERRADAAKGERGRKPDDFGIGSSGW
jgi:hypothetical protein